jgi:type III secretory pathway component EscS
VAINSIAVLAIYLVIGAVIGIMMALAPGQHNRCPFKHRLMLFMILFVGWLPMSIIALTFVPVMQVCCPHNLR